MRGLRDGEWPAAAGVAARAMWDEPYLHVTYGDDPVHRFAADPRPVRGRRPDRAAHPYRRGRRRRRGGGRGAAAGHVRLLPPPITAEEIVSEDPMDVAFRRVRLDARARDAHRSLEAHWYLAPLAVEPVVQGAGLGRRLMDAFHEATAATSRRRSCWSAPRTSAASTRLGDDPREDISADGNRAPCDGARAALTWVAQPLTPRAEGPLIRAWRRRRNRRMSASAAMTTPRPAPSSSPTSAATRSSRRSGATRRPRGLPRGSRSRARSASRPTGDQLIELRGDEALAVFDSARQAIRAAIELQRRFVDETVADPTLPLPVGSGSTPARPFRSRTGTAAARSTWRRGCARSRARRRSWPAGRSSTWRARSRASRSSNAAPSDFKGLAEPVQVVRLRAEADDPSEDLAFPPRAGSLGGPAHAGRPRRHGREPVQGPARVRGG